MNFSSESKEIGPIEVFRVGQFKSQIGFDHDISAGDLQVLAAAYDPVLSPAPVVIGHPKTDAPAYGWVSRLFVEGDKLKAYLDQVTPEFVEMVKQGRFKKISISLFLPGSPANPKKDELYLRHVGFLGAAAPAVPGLKPVSFADWYGDGEDPQLILEQDSVGFAGFSDELSRLRKEVQHNRIEGLIREGKLLPCLAGEVAVFAESIAGTEPLCFAEGQESQTRGDWFFSFLVV